MHASSLYDEIGFGCMFMLNKERLFSRYLLLYLQCNNCFIKCILSLYHCTSVAIWEWCVLCFLIVIIGAHAETVMD